MCGTRTISNERPERALWLAPGVSLRPEPFGAVAYVAERDDFFLLDHEYAAVAFQAAKAVKAAEHGPGTGATAFGGAAAAEHRERAKTLAALGICRTTPATPERPHLGRSLVGGFVDVPILAQPLVVNCFSTAHCPLLCTYCHADDLMIPFRGPERWVGVESVASTAALVPALVGVVTGGDPIVRPGRASWLISRLAHTKRVVLDTSGVGDIRLLLPVLVRHGVHVRVSLDSADPGVNDRVRPSSPAYVPRGTSSFRHAHITLRTLAEAGVPCSVQTVVSRHNETLDDLLALRDHLVAFGVRHWVLHIAVPAGKAARHRQVLPGEHVLDRLRALVMDSASGGTPLDIRVTGTNRTPNSVLLIDPRGRLCIERSDGGGKQVIWHPGESAGEPEIVARYRRHVDLLGHASRYLNGTLEPVPQPVAVL